jgi:dynein heavy chain
LLRGKRVIGANSNLDWLPTSSWNMVKALSNLEVFKSLASDIEGSSKQWKKYCENEAPENEKLPQVYLYLTLGMEKQKCFTENVYSSLFKT